MNSRMTDLDTLMPRVLPQVLPCLRGMAMDALQMAAVEFFTESGAWFATLQEGVSPCDAIIQLSLPRDVLVATVYALWLDGSKVDATLYHTSAREITLRETPQRAAVAVVEASLRPTRTATALPEELLEEWGDTIAFGALARLKAMSGKGIEWSDPRGAEINFQLYTEGVAKARARKLRRRFGSGAIFINMGD